jgi:hypothetical protein
MLMHITKSSSRGILTATSLIKRTLRVWGSRLVRKMFSLLCGDAYFPADGPSSEDAEKIGSELEVFATEFPRALVPQRILLTVTRGEQFERLVKKYIHRALKRNLPSLFVDLKPLYNDQDKRQIIQSIVEDYKTELEAAKGADTDGKYL